MLSRTSFTTRRLHTRRSITHSSTSRISLHINDNFTVGFNLNECTIYCKRCASNLQHRTLDRAGGCTLEITEDFTALRSLQRTKWQSASWNFHATARANTNNKQDIQSTESAVFFCSNNFSHLHSGACEEQKIWPSCCQCRVRESERSGMSLVWDLRLSLSRAPDINPVATRNTTTEIFW